MCSVVVVVVVCVWRVTHKLHKQLSHILIQDLTAMKKKNRSLEHVRSMIYAVRRLRPSTMFLSFSPSLLLSPLSTLLSSLIPI